MLGSQLFKQEWLTANEKNILNASYCGLCHGLRGNFGLATAFLVNQEARFITLLIAGQRKETAQYSSTNCPLTAYTKPAAILDDSSAHTFSASVTMLLAKEKLDDNIRDENQTASRIFLHVFRQLFTKATNTLKESGFPYQDIVTIQQEQVDIEKSLRTTSLISYLEPTALAVGRIFAHTSVIASAPENSPLLEKLGQAIGRIVTLSDSCSDFSSDRKKGQFNPIMNCWNYKNDKEFVPLDVLYEIVGIYLEQLFQIKQCLDTLSFQNFSRLIENTLKGGIPLIIYQALQKMWKTNHWKGKFPENSPFLMKTCSKCGLPHNVPDKISTKTKNGTLSEQIWILATSLPQIEENANELGFSSRKDYVLSCILPLLSTP